MASNTPANDISVHGYDARRQARTVDEVAIPRWAAELATTTMPHLCSVCLGLSPSWDGHDVNPPCIGAAREAIQVALDGIPQRSTGVAPAGGKL